MASGTESVTIEKVWDDQEPFAVYKIPSGYSGKVLMVYETPDDVSVRVVIEEEYRNSVEALLHAERPKQEKRQRQHPSVYRRIGEGSH